MLSGVVHKYKISFFLDLVLPQQRVGMFSVERCMLMYLYLVLLPDQCRKMFNVRYHFSFTLQIYVCQSCIVMLSGGPVPNRARLLSLHRNRQQGDQATFLTGVAAPRTLHIRHSKRAYTRTLRRHGSLSVEPIF